MIEVLDSGVYRPISLELWNNPAPVPVELVAGDLVGEPVNIYKMYKGKKRWGWRYVILRKVKEDVKDEA